MAKVSKYKVTLTEELRYSMDVVASSEKEAVSILQKLYREDKIVLSREHLYDSTIKATLIKDLK